MSTYTAVIGDVASVGTLAANQDITTAAASARRRNPAVASARIRNVVAPHIVSDAVGGLLTADFTIPAWEAQQYRGVLRYGAVVWLFDGSTPIFYGWAEQPTWTTTGDCQMNISGPWVILGRSRMREVYDLWDMTLLTRGTGAGENKAGNVSQNSDGSITLSFPSGTTLAASDRVSVDYFLFGEAAGPNDAKAITAFEFDISDSNGLSAAHRFKVIGRDSPGGGTSDEIWNAGTSGPSNIQGAQNLAGLNAIGGQWPNTNGYRCLRFQLVFTSAATISADTYVTLDRIRVGTREALFQGVTGGVVDPYDTGVLARDLLTLKSDGSANDVSVLDMPQEFWQSGVTTLADSATFVYQYGLNPVTPPSSAPDSAIGVTGFSALEWQNPADILTDLAAVDASNVGFYLPYNGRSGYDAPGSNISGAGFVDVGSFWLSAPPQLYYQAFTDPTTNPDYLIIPREGATVEPDTDVQMLSDNLYVNYQTNKGSQRSVVETDASTLNYLYAQGFRRADDYTFEPSSGDDQMPVSAAKQAMRQRRNPNTAATITIENDGSARYPILKGGAAIPKLATIRPGTARVADAGPGLRSGWVTHVEWWGQTLTDNEKVELTLGLPGAVTGTKAVKRVTGKLANRTLKRRHRILF